MTTPKELQQIRVLAQDPGCTTRSRWKASLLPYIWTASAFANGTAQHIAQMASNTDETARKAAVLAVETSRGQSDFELKLGEGDP